MENFFDSYGIERLAANILENYYHLSSDFVGLKFNFADLIIFIINLLISVGCVAVFYVVGNKIRILLIANDKSTAFYEPFINAALGYIYFGFGIAVMGVTSILYRELIYIFIILSIFGAFFPIREKPFINFKNSIKFSKKKLKINNFIFIGTVLFVLVSFLRLIIPESGEDGYHIDLPVLYLENHSSIIQASDPLRVIPYNQLAEMVNVIPISFGAKSAIRIINFSFYLIIVMLLFRISKEKHYSFSKYAPLLFVSAPIIIKYSTSTYTDLILVFLFLLSLVLIRKNSIRKLIISGIIFGGACSVKLWFPLYLPAVIFYIAFINRKNKLAYLLKVIIIFSLTAISVASIWYLRNYFITGNPIYPFLSTVEYLEASKTFKSESIPLLGLNLKMFYPVNLITLGPLYIFSIVFFILNLKPTIRILSKSRLFGYFILLFVTQLFTVHIFLGRHLISWFGFSVIFLSSGINFILTKNKLFTIGFVIMYALIFSYYLTNTLFLLPYGLGWAEKNHYLTRVLYRDNASYYDFDYKFSPKINNNDYIATYGIYNFYYADFKYIDINFVFSKQNRNFNLLKKHGVTKLLINGGDLIWFCRQISIQSCDKSKVRLLVSYPPGIGKFNLYTLE